MSVSFIRYKLSRSLSLSGTQTCASVLRLSKNHEFKDFGLGSSGETIDVRIIPPIYVKYVSMYTYNAPIIDDLPTICQWGKPVAPQFFDKRSFL